MQNAGRDNPEQEGAPRQQTFPQEMGRAAGISTPAQQLSGRETVTLCGHGQKLLHANKNTTEKTTVLGEACGLQSYRICPSRSFK